MASELLTPEDVAALRQDVYDDPTLVDESGDGGAGAGAVSGGPLSIEEIAALRSDIPPSTLKVNKPSAWGDVMRGIDNLQATGGGLAMLLGNASGLEGLEQWGEEVYKRNDMEARMNPAAVGSFANIESPSDLLVYAREAVLENLASFAPAVITGGIGGAIGKKTAETIVRNMAEKMTAEQVAKLVAKRIFIAPGSIFSR